MRKVSTQEFKQMREKNPDMPVVNVLGEDDFRKEHIPGSMNIPQDRGDFARRVERTVGDKHKPVLVHCASKDCNAGATAVKKLEEAGFDNILDYEGGMRDWKESGNAVESSEPAARMQS